MSGAVKTSGTQPKSPTLEERADEIESRLHLLAGAFQVAFDRINDNCEDDNFLGALALIRMELLAVRDLSEENSHALLLSRRLAA